MPPSIQKQDSIDNTEKVVLKKNHIILYNKMNLSITSNIKGDQSMDALQNKTWNALFKTWPAKKFEIKIEN